MTYQRTINIITSHLDVLSRLAVVWILQMVFVRFLNAAGTIVHDVYSAKVSYAIFC